MPTMMKLSEFKELFLSVACVKLEYNRANALVNLYFMRLKEFTVEEFRSAALDYTTEETGYKFPEPVWWINKIKTLRRHNSIQQSDDYYHSKKYIDKCNSEEAKKSRRQFLEDINSIALAAKTGTEVEIQGKIFKPLKLVIKTDNFDYPISGLHEILINDPLKNAKQWEKRYANQS